jgi:hypothetical protein
LEQFLYFEIEIANVSSNYKCSRDPYYTTAINFHQILLHIHISFTITIAL